VMKVSSVSSSETVAPINNRIQKEIQQLLKQKEGIQEQITKVNESKLDLKEKLERIKELQGQMEQIDMQIRQLQLEARKPDRTKIEEKQDQYVGKSEKEDANSPSLTHLMKARTLYSDFQQLGKIRNQLERTINTAKKELATDKGRSKGYADFSAKEKAISDLEERKKAVEKKMAEKREKIGEENKKQGEKTAEEKVEDQEKEQSIDIVV